VFFKLRSSKKKPLKTNDQKPQQFWRQPLIHFFILGLAVFGLHAVLDRKPAAIDDDPHLVEVSSADIEWMWTMFNKQMGREPTVQDLRGQVNQLIREQILSREAIAMGLDEGDIVVRRRLAQKMEFLFKDLSALTELKEDDLRKYFFENRPKYEIPPQVTFNQVYFSIDSRGVDGARQAVQALIEEGDDPSKAPTLGDASILSPDCAQCSVREIRDRFGTDFAEVVKNLEPGSWYGPVKSAYGFHAVYIHERQDANLPNFQDIIDQVRNDWMFTNQEENTRKVYGEIRSRYQVLVEGLPYDFDVKG
jgi:hypothetical protein